MTVVPLHGTGAVPAGGNLDAAVFLVVGILGGAHCLGMCGPLVSVYADRLRAQEGSGEATLTVRQVRQHVVFNLGRTAGYAAVGAVLAAVGAAAVGATDRLLAVGTSVQAVTALLTGGFIAAMGLSYARGSVAHPSFGPLDGLFGRVSRVLTARVDEFVGDARIAGLGVVHALLPCPITYPAYAYAFALGDPVRAAFLLALVGLGTFPTLLVYGTVFGSLSASQRVHRVLGVVFVVLGYTLVAHGLNLFGIGVPQIELPLPAPEYGPR
ncbi:sulfite exporter TauE/SafE family protein [Halorussus salilacus]|uniref:sulfite exporter TauE/SafE family protein n=1 Tax=Halorussus salilacus TaxID=2953750 RepID=UPI0020A1CEAF|nr:sulfite exporter TauE/SafE family protein [Halorussus salilacus]USZ69432.1 sulfite exporter TauE/SafE family protein [Halorussus salilacus]